MALNFKKYLPEFVYGAIDGSITTFAVVSGSLGASLSPAIVLILGFANLFGDGFSMAVSNYLSTKSQIDLERRKGKNPLKTALVTFLSFLIVGFIPLFSFVIAPFNPYIELNKFFLSFVLTGFAFILVGAAKGKIVKKNAIRSALETLIIGTLAALIAFITGHFINQILH